MTVFCFFLAHILRPVHGFPWLPRSPRAQLFIEEFAPRHIRREGKAGVVARKSQLEALLDFAEAFVLRDVKGLAGFHLRPFKGAGLSVDTSRLLDAHAVFAFVRALLPVAIQELAEGDKRVKAKEAAEEAAAAAAVGSN